ncbi:MAG TPA: DUF779 domain-containing protein [Gaiellales bacterium]|jgi:hypothetical protein|nr:DUF779 domain-containing protein [Gaiellales bacterium]
MHARVSATDAALGAIEALTLVHGGVVFFQSGGCCDGSSPICLPEGELPLSPHDLKLGEVGGAPVYIDAELYERWNRPAFELDVSQGAPEGFSLGAGDTHFVTRTAEDVTHA